MGTSCTASVRLRLRPLPTPWDRCMLGFPWLMPSPPDILTMLESSLTWSPLSITVSTILTWDSDSTDKVSEHLSAPDNDCLAIVNDKMNKMQYWSFNKKKKKKKKKWGFKKKKKKKKKKK